MTHILLETTRAESIPVLTLEPDGAHRAPVVFYIPGYGNDKESGLNLGYRLAQRGFFFVSFDPWLHGERFDPRLDHSANPDQGGIYPPETGLDTYWTFIQVIHHCLLDVQTLLAHYEKDSRVDVNRSGVTGPSMGGYASFLVFANLPTIPAAVPMIGIPTFARRLRDILDECEFSNREWAEAMARVADITRERTAFVQEIDPAPRLLQAAPRALLIMNNDFDSDQPKHYSIEFYRELLPRYHDVPDNLKLNIYPAGHTVTPDMERDAVTWFEQHLGAL